MPTCVCATCSQHFTRKYSGYRHNLSIHSGKGLIVGFLDYLVGRVTGQYAAADPLFYRKNKGDKFRHSSSSVVNTDYPPSSASSADSIGENESHEMPPNHHPSVQVRNNNYDFRSLDYTIDVVRRVKEIENLRTTQGSTASRFDPTIPASLNGTHCVGTDSFLSQQFNNSYIFGYVGYVCPMCAHYAIYQLEYMNGSLENRTWLTHHKCNNQDPVMGEKRQSGDIQYVRACDSRPFLLDLFARAWLKNNFNIFAIRLPSLYDMDRGFVEIPDMAEPSKSICICISKDEIINLNKNREHWAGRAVANENEPTPISEQELFDFLHVTQSSTFAVINVRSADPPGWKNEYFMIYLGK